MLIEAMKRIINSLLSYEFLTAFLSSLGFGVMAMLAYGCYETIYLLPILDEAEGMMIHYITYSVSACLVAFAITSGAFISLKFFRLSAFLLIFFVSFLILLLGNFVSTYGYGIGLFWIMLPKLQTLWESLFFLLFIPLSFISSILAGASLGAAILPLFRLNLSRKIYSIVIISAAVLGLFLFFPALHGLCPSFFWTQMFTVAIPAVGGYIWIATAISVLLANRFK